MVTIKLFSYDYQGLRVQIGKYNNGEDLEDSIFIANNTSSKQKRDT